MHSNRFKIVVFILGAFAIAQAAASITLYLLPSVKSNTFYKDIQKPKFFYALSNSFAASSAKPLSAYTLKAVFASSSGGFILFYDGNKQVVLDVGDEYGGYKLVELANGLAIFEKDNRRYELSLNKSEDVQQTITKHNVDKLFNNPAELINEIDITQADNGLLVLKIKPNGIFDKMGLKVGDILQELNNEKLSSMAALANLMPTLLDAKEVKLQILRDNQEKELTYAIK